MLCSSCLCCLCPSRRNSGATSRARRARASVRSGAVCDVADGGLSIALGTMMRRATCDVQSATADDCKLRVAACRMRPSGTMKMVCCVPSLTHKYTPRCSHLLGRARSQVAPRRNGGLVACDGVSWSRVGGGPLRFPKPVGRGPELVIWLTVRVTPQTSNSNEKGNKKEGAFSFRHAMNPK